MGIGIQQWWREATFGVSQIDIWQNPPRSSRRSCRRRVSMSAHGLQLWQRHMAWPKSLRSGVWWLDGNIYFSTMTLTVKWHSLPSYLTCYVPIHIASNFPAVTRIQIQEEVVNPPIPQYSHHPETLVEYWIGLVRNSKLLRGWFFWRMDFDIGPSCRQLRSFGRSATGSRPTVGQIDGCVSENGAHW